MKLLESQNLFELETLEPRILLSGDSFLAGLAAAMPDDSDRLLNTDPGLSPSEEIRQSDEDYLQETSSQHSDPYDPAHKIEDLFAGLSQEPLFADGSEQGTLEEVRDPDSAFSESSPDVREHYESS
jgi:hypothetical protein